MEIGRIFWEIQELPAADARNAEGASMAQLLIPKPADLMDKDACFRASLLSWILQIHSSKDLWS
jgi:hypothetical protein